MTVKRYGVGRCYLMPTDQNDTLIRVVLASDHEAEVEKWRKWDEARVSNIHDLHEVANGLRDEVERLTRENAALMSAGYAGTLQKEVRRLRGQVARLTDIIRKVHGNLLDDRIDSALKEQGDE